MFNLAPAQIVAVIVCVCGAIGAGVGAWITARYSLLSKLMETMKGFADTQASDAHYLRDKVIGIEAVQHTLQTELNAVNVKLVETQIQLIDTKNKLTIVEAENAQLRLQNGIQADEIEALKKENRRLSSEHTEMKTAMSRLQSVDGIDKNGLIV